ncbi:centromere protein F-like isoform X1 [Mobula hypostoma]|uniref:centromere protein F-like isoform X1 n=2 Tax=Mobula hypostoma TaxID=723540 RepID=UPI002FC37186
MSWALEEWKSGLPSRAVQKIAEYESQLEKLKKERQQKQLQLDSLEVAFQKENKKLEDEKNENASLKRETQSLKEACTNLEKAQQRFCHEVQVKEALVCSLQGQLLAARKQIDEQEREIKRLEAELERSQRASAGTECHLPTPTKSFPGCTALSVEDPKWVELQGKYSREVEEKKRLSSEVKALKLQVQQLQFSSNKNHRESAPQQIRASTFSWQQEKAPAQVAESPVRHGSSSSVFPWEQPRASLYHNPRSPQQNNKTSHLELDSKDNHLEESVRVQVQELRKENQVLQCTMSELELWVQSQEKEIKNHLNKLQEAQSLLEKCRGELAAKESALCKSRDDLERAAAQQEQARNKCALLEQKLKQLSEELNCQRQNAESARRTMEQKTKSREKEYQQELSDQQRAYQSLDHQCKQEKNQLNQEIQQLKAEHLALQAKINQMAAGKRLVDKELEDVKAKLSWAEKELATHQKNGDDLQKNLQCALKEKERVSAWQEQSAQRIVHLEAQLKRLEQQLAESQRSREEIKAENLALVSQLEDLQEKLRLQSRADPESVDPSSHDSNRNDAGAISKSDHDEEPKTCQSEGEKPDDAETVLRSQPEATEEALDSMEGSQLGKVRQRDDLDPGPGGDEEDDHTTGPAVSLGTEPYGKPEESQVSEKTVKALRSSEEEMETRLPALKVEAKKELGASAAETTVVPEEKAEGVDRPDKPDTRYARLGEIELKLEEVEGKNQVLQCELDNVRRELESKVAEGRKDRQTVAELRRKLKQAAKRCAAEAERSNALGARQAEQIGTLEKELEQERALVVKLQEAAKMLEDERSKASRLSRSGGGHVGSSDEIEILQNAASKKMQQLQQQIVDLKREEVCIEEIMKANSENRDALEPLKQRDAQSLELSQLSSDSSNHSNDDPSGTMERKLDEENLGFTGITKGGDKSRELFLECLRSQVLEQSGFSNQLKELQKHLAELQQRCEALTREKEEAGEAKRRAQDMFDNLQSRIHSETQQLTVALEAQSKNIEDLLLSLEEKDGIIQVLNRRLRGALKTLACINQENRDLKANLKTVTVTSEGNRVNPPEEVVLEQSRGRVPQANQSARENSSPSSMASSAHGAEENAQESEPGRVQRLEPGRRENAFDDPLLLPREQVTEASCCNDHDEAKVPLLNSPAAQNVPGTDEVVEKQLPGEETIHFRNVLSDDALVAGEQKADSVPRGAQGTASPLDSERQAVAQVKQGAQIQRRLGREGSGSGDVVKDGQHIRCPDGLQVNVGERGKGMTVLCDKETQSENEPLIERATGSADTRTNTPGLEEEKPAGELTEEVEGVNHRLNEERSQGVVDTLNERLSCLDEKCRVLEREKEWLSLEVGRLQEAASGLQREKDGLMATIQSGEALREVSTDEQSRLREELAALQEWKQRVLEDAATSEAQEASGQVELRSLRGSLLEWQSQAETLAGECRSLKDTAENAKVLQRHLQQELQQALSEKAVLQNQVEHLQNLAAELNKENSYLQGQLKQWESPPTDKEVPTDCRQQRGLHDDLLLANIQQQDAAQITARKMQADLEALKRTVQKKNEEVDHNLLAYADLPNGHREPEIARSATAESPPPRAEPENRGASAGCEPEPSADGFAAEAERGPADPGERSDYVGQPAGRSARSNFGELAMRINPAELATRIRRSRQFRNHLSVAFDETEYEPYGLPDVVQKGFADIPSGSFCPHVLRRGILNSALCPQQQEEGPCD